MKKLLIGLALAAGMTASAAPVLAYAPAVESWRPIVQDACQGSADCESRIMWLISCESGGNSGAAAYNPESGNMTLGLLQIDELWGSIAYADGASQIYWTAAHLGSVWWQC